MRSTVHKLVCGRRTQGLTTRDGGATWDETRWEYAPASGVNTAKVYAGGSRITYDYTDNCRKTRTTWARGAWGENAYNTRGLIVGVTYSDATPAVSYTYTQSHQLASAALSDGTSYAYFYDDRLLCTNEAVSGMGDDALAVMRTYDDYRRPSTTSVLITNIAHAAKNGSSGMTVGGFPPHKFAWPLFYGLPSRSSGPRNFD